MLVIPTVAAGGPGGFTERADEVGLTGQTSIAEVSPILGGGAVGDFNRDGWLDVFFPAGGFGPDQLFINDGDGTFTDRAAEWGVAITHLSNGAAVADYDGDGLLDIYVLIFGDSGAPEVGRHILYRNTGTAFVDVTAIAGVSQTSTTTPDGWSASWGDYDLDGDVDLAVTGYRDDPTSNRLFRNEGDGTFTDVTVSAGLANVDEIRGFAPVFADMNHDRYPELVWIGDFSTSKYYVNNGGSFSDFTDGSNTSLDFSEMGVSVADWDGDGAFDFYVSTIGTNNLYLNQGGHVYVNHADAAGVAVTGWGWGVVDVDYDNDSHVEMIVASQEARTYAFRNTGAAPLQFVERGLHLGFAADDDGRGIAELDADNDGDQDILIFSSGRPLRYYENQVASAENHWLRVWLNRGEMTDIAPDGIGAIVDVHLGERVLRSHISASSNYLAQGEMVAHFGLGSADVVDEVRVHWPNGHMSRQYAVAADQNLEITANGTVFLDGFDR